METPCAQTPADTYAYVIASWVRAECVEIIEPFDIRRRSVFGCDLRNGFIMDICMYILSQEDCFL
jgi:hypothetical protein